MGLLYEGLPWYPAHSRHLVLAVRCVCVYKHIGPAGGISDLREHEKINP